MVKKWSNRAKMFSSVLETYFIFFQQKILSKNEKTYEKFRKKRGKTMRKFQRW